MCLHACVRVCVYVCVPELNKLCNLQGRQVEYVRQDDSNRRWFNEFRSKSTSTPIGLETVDGWYHIWLCCVNCVSGGGVGVEGALGSGGCQSMGGYGCWLGGGGGGELWSVGGYSCELFWGVSVMNVLGEGGIDVLGEGVYVRGGKGYGCVGEGRVCVCVCVCVGCIFCRWRGVGWREYYLGGEVCLWGGMGGGGCEWCWGGGGGGVFWGAVKL